MWFGLLAVLERRAVRGRFLRLRFGQLDVLRLLDVGRSNCDPGLHVALCIGLDLFDLLPDLGAPVLDVFPLRGAPEVEANLELVVARFGRVGDERDRLLEAVWPSVVVSHAGRADGTDVVAGDDVEFSDMFHAVLVFTVGSDET